MTGDTEETGLEIRRIIPATPLRVFEAWTSPEALLDWWGPPGGSCTNAEVDLRIGGQYRIVNLLADLSTVIITGRFLDVVRPDSLSYTWEIDDETSLVEHVSVQFKQHGDGTEVVISHQRTTLEKLEGHRAGWDACLSGLAVHVIRMIGEISE